MPPYITRIDSSKTYYRVTPTVAKTRSHSLWKKIVDGTSTKRNPEGGRYNFGGVPTVYLTDTPEACFSEKLYYFLKNHVTELDVWAKSTGYSPPLPSKKCIIWEIKFTNDINDILNLNTANCGVMGIIPSLMVSPTQDYEHLKRQRAIIESTHPNIKGIKVKSCRDSMGGNVIVLFEDQTSNVDTILPYEVELKLVQETTCSLFINCLNETLNFGAAKVQITNPNPISSTKLKKYRIDKEISFNRY